MLAVGDLKVFLPAESRLMLDGVTIDFRRHAHLQRPCTFFNPNAENACGCLVEQQRSAQPPGVAKVTSARSGGS